METDKHDRSSSCDTPVPDAEEIRAQSARILSSPAFELSERNKAFFSFVVEEAVAGRGDKLKGPLIAARVFGRGKHFDAAHDPVVRTEARKLRTALDNYYLRDGVGDPIRIQIPKGTYTPVFKIHTATIGSLPNESNEPNIVVMPFDLLSDDANNSYLAAGFTEDITSALTRYEHLRVIASSTAWHLHHQGLSESEIGRNLGVRFLLTGSLGQNGTALKISVKLIDTASGLVRWSEQYRRHLAIEELFDLQEEIARAVVAKLGGSYGVLATQIFSEARAKTPPSLTAYEALLTYYCHYNMSPSPESLRDTLDIVKSALEREPEYGHLWSALAAMYADNYIAEFYPIEVFPLKDAEIYARKGVELDPDNQATHMGLAYIHLLLDDPDRYAEEGEYAYRLNPNNAYYVGVYGHFELFVGHWERGLSLLQESIRLNPYYPNFFSISLFLHAYALGEYQDAYKKAMNFDVPGLYLSPLYQAAALGQLERQEDADATLGRLLQLRPDFPAHAQDLIGRQFKAEGQVEHIIEGLQKAGLRLE